MKVSNINKAVSLSLSAIAFLISIGAGFNSYAQDGSPELYIPSQIESEEPDLIEESYIYEEQYYGEEEQYYEDQVEEDTSSVSMLTFNFLFYMVYKLKFSDNLNKEETAKTADD